MSHTKRRKLANSFLTTVAVAATAASLGAAGCSTNVRFADTCTFGDDGCDASCPELFPDSGDSCLQLGQTCSSYGDCNEIRATCGDDGQWEVENIQSSCNPPPPDPVCPPQMPVDGEVCQPDWTGVPYECPYLDPFCDVEVFATCTSEGSWSLNLIDCNPPPVSDCRLLGNETDCTLFAECRWLVPGCDGSDLGEAGCYPAEPCTTGSCLNGEACVEVSYDPCYNSACNVCAAPTNVCMPQLGG